MAKKSAFTTSTILRLSAFFQVGVVVFFLLISFCYSEGNKCILPTCDYVLILVLKFLLKAKPPLSGGGGQTKDGKGLLEIKVQLNFVAEWI